MTNADLRLATGATAGGWLINPFPTVLTFDTLGVLKTVSLPVWAYFAAAVPALLLYVLLFMETHICELLMMDRTNAMPTPKGAGVHWDIVLLCGLNCLGAFFGGPWVCAATVRAVAHVSALTVMSTTHAPGEQASIVNVKDQRVSFLLVSVLLGVSVVLAPLLKHVPFAVLFGVFLYMGVSGINGIQLFDRIALVLQPVKHHPSVSYVRRVCIFKYLMHTVTLQLLSLILGKNDENAFVYSSPNPWTWSFVGSQKFCHCFVLPVFRCGYDTFAHVFEIPFYT